MGWLNQREDDQGRFNWLIFSFVITNTEFVTRCQIFIFKCILPGFGKTAKTHENLRSIQDLKFLLFYFPEGPGDRGTPLLKEHIKISVGQNTSHGK